MILLNNCLRNSSFPEIWRQARLRSILKDIQKDPAMVSSYRPIALLPVLGKIFERIIANRIGDLYKAQGLSNDSQFGFRPGRGTDDALYRIVSLIKGRDKKYVVIIFFDIAGAFDNLWWPAILKRVTKTCCSSQLFNVLKEYFSNRQMILTSRHDKITKKMTKGCPQGSIIGPLAWNWCMDDLLNQLGTLEEGGTHVTVYADDLALIICQSSRVKIEESASVAIEMISNWCTAYKLKIAADKTKAVLVKGNFDHERMPRLIIQNKKIKFVNEHKYLGVYINKKLTFMPHVRYLKDKINALSGLSRKTVQEEWGLRRKAYMLLYRCLYIPVIVYGAIAWFERTSHSHMERTLNSIQRRLLIAMTRACRTCSMAAMQVIAGCMPLEIIRKALITKATLKEKASWSTYQFDPGKIQSGYIEREKEKLKVVLYNQWQSNWDEDAHGRTTYRFIPEVTFFDSTWFKPNRECVNVITGYGSINKTLYERNCVESPKCHMCPEDDEIVEHMLFYCPLYSVIREQYIYEQRKQITWKGLLENEDRFRMFYVTEIFRIRKESIRQTSGS